VDLLAHSPSVWHIVILPVQFQLLLLILPHLADNIGELRRVAFLKVLIHVDVVAVGVANLFESVHIELPNEGGKIVMLEVTRQHLLREPRDILDIEGVQCTRPTHHIRDRLVLGKQCFTDTIYSSLEMNIGIAAFFDFFGRVRLIMFTDKLL
jgi:hypothetical protein